MKRISPHPNPVDDSPLKWMKRWEEAREEIRQQRIEEEQKKEHPQEDYTAIENPEEQKDLDKEKL